MQPKGPGSSIGRRDKADAAKLRKSPPSVTTTASSPIACCTAASTRFGCRRPSERRAAPRPWSAAALRRAPRAPLRSRSAQCLVDGRKRGCRPSRRSRAVPPPASQDLDRRRGGYPAIRRGHRRCGGSFAWPKIAGRAISELEVEPTPDSHHDVGVAASRRRASPRRRRGARPAPGPRLSPVSR